MGSKEDERLTDVLRYFCYTVYSPILGIMSSQVIHYNTTLRNMNRQKRARKKRLLRLITLIITMVLLVTTSRMLAKRHHQVEVASVSTSITPSVSVEPTNTIPSIPAIKDPLILEASSKGIEDAAAKGLVGTKGTYSMIVKNLKTNESYAADEHRTFQTGSLYKLWVMATVYGQMKQGMIKETEVVKENIDTLYKTFNLDASYSDRKEGEISLTIAEALERMIIVSDNDAALLLTRRVGASKITRFLQDYGFTESKVSDKNNPPSSTTYDIALFFDRLYKKKLVDETYSEKMLSLLKRQSLNQKIPKYLPEEIAVAHKTGELDGFSHDAGIVYAPSGDYIFVMLSESTARLQANERIALVSKEIYNYFSGQDMVEDN